jgi:hypothetical protein
MKSNGRGALVGSGTVLALAVAQMLVTSPAQARPVGSQAAQEQHAATRTGWRVSGSIAVKQQVVAMADVDADSARDAWAVGLTASETNSGRLVLEHWSGRAWRRITLSARLVKGFKTGPDVSNIIVGATSPRDVWIIGGTGYYLSRIGDRWTTGRLPVVKADVLIPASVKVFSRDDVWVFGCRKPAIGVAAADRSLEWYDLASSVCTAQVARPGAALGDHGDLRLQYLGGRDGPKRQAQVPRGNRALERPELAE